MNQLKRVFLVLMVIGVFTLNLCGRSQSDGSDGTIIIEQTAGEADEWTDPVF
jgi:hypothetical protein